MSGGIQIGTKNHTVGAKVWTFNLIQDYRTKSDDNIFEMIFWQRLHLVD